MSVKSFWSVDVRDSPKNRPFFVFHTIGPGDSGVQIRKDYAHLACRDCGYFEPRRAARIGIHPEVRCPFRDRDVVTSDETRLIVSVRCRRVFESLPGVEFEYYDLPGDSKYFLAFAKHRVYPPRELRLTPAHVMPWDIHQPFAADERCKSCGRYRGVAFREEYFVPKRRFSFLAVILERGGWCGYLEAWLASDEIAAALKKANLKGLWLHKVTPQPPPAEQVATRRKRKVDEPTKAAPRKRVR